VCLLTTCSKELFWDLAATQHGPGCTCFIYSHIFSWKYLNCVMTCWNAIVSDILDILLRHSKACLEGSLNAFLSIQVTCVLWYRTCRLCHCDIRFESKALYQGWISNSSIDRTSYSSTHIDESVLPLWGLYMEPCACSLCPMNPHDSIALVEAC